MPKSEHTKRVITQEEFDKRYEAKFEELAKRIASNNAELSEARVKLILYLLICELQKDGKVWKDVDWPYFDRRETNAPGKCSMLDLCLHIERMPGVVLHIDLSENVKLK